MEIPLPAAVLRGPSELPHLPLRQLAAFRISGVGINFHYPTNTHIANAYCKCLTDSLYDFVPPSIDGEHFARLRRDITATIARGNFGAVLFGVVRSAQDDKPQVEILQHW